MTDTRSEARKLLDRHTSEADFQALIVELALRTGWLTFHLNDQLLREAVKSGRFDALTGIEHFPDLLLLNVRFGRLAVLECKTERGSVDGGQQEWLDAWSAVIAHITGLDVALCSDVMIDVVRPRDWDRIEAFLTGEDRT